MKVIILLFVASVYALTCQNYEGTHCVSVGCDVHCQGIGKNSGYCAYGGGSCICHCVSYGKRDTQELSVILKKKNMTESKLSMAKSGTCTCMYGGQCYSCGAVVMEALVCYQDGTWQNCYGEHFTECSERACI